MKPDLLDVELRFVLRRNKFRRWIVAQEGNERFAWSGSTWVKIGGNVQISNFTTTTEALEYAGNAGLKPAESEKDN